MIDIDMSMVHKLWSDGALFKIDKYFAWISFDGVNFTLAIAKDLGMNISFSKNGHIHYPKPGVEDIMVSAGIAEWWYPDDHGAPLLNYWLNI